MASAQAWQALPAAWVLCLPTTCPPAYASASMYTANLDAVGDSIAHKQVRVHGLSRQAQRQGAPLDSEWYAQADANRDATQARACQLAAVYRHVVRFCTKWKGVISATTGTGLHMDD